jgi:hypothetical protein
MRGEGPFAPRWLRGQLRPSIDLTGFNLGKAAELRAAMGGEVLRRLCLFGLEA